MDLKDCYVEEDSKASMWSWNELEIFDAYAKGNTNTRKDAETCLQEYSPRFKWSENSRALDIGSGDGGVTSIIAKYIPSYCELIGSDLNENIVKYANQKNGNGRIKFIQFDVVGQVPMDMIGKFDHVYAMYMFHWVKDHETAFTNIYNILPKNGEFFAIYIAYCDIYSIFRILAKRTKWAQWMTNVDAFVSLHYECEDPDATETKILNKVGFETVDVKCKQRYCIHESVEEFKALITGINAFDIPKHKWADFLDDFIEVKRYMNLIDAKGRVKSHYNLMVIHCVK